MRFMQEHFMGLMIPVSGFACQQSRHEEKVLHMLLDGQRSTSTTPEMRKCLLRKATSQRTDPIGWGRRTCIRSGKSSGFVILDNRLKLPGSTSTLIRWLVACDRPDRYQRMHGQQSRDATCLIYDDTPDDARQLER